MSLDQAMKKLKFDARLVEQNLNNGQLTKEEWEAYLKSLPDCAAESMSLNLEEESHLNGQAH